MTTGSRSPSPTILLRITDGGAYMHRAFNDFNLATRSAEAFAGAGFAVAMHSATGQFLQRFAPRHGAPAARPGHGRGRQGPPAQY